MALLVLSKHDRWLKMADIKLEPNKLFRTFKTQQEVSDYIEMHIPEEKRLLYMGFFFGLNYASNQVNETFNLTYKKEKK